MAPEHASVFVRAARCGMRARFAARALWPAVFALALALSACQSSDPAAGEKNRTLTPDERYLVEYYMKIIHFEKQQFDSPELREEKKNELEAEFDGERLHRTIASLEKEPERWLAIYNRINELQLRELQQPTE